MKGAIDVRVILGLSLLAMGGARAQAAEVVGDSQEQARLLLSGRGAPKHGPEAGLVFSSSALAKSIALDSLDAQAQAREMILGRQIAKGTIIDTYGSRADSAAGDRKVVADPQELVRRMILGSQSVDGKPKIRLTGKAEQLKRRPQEEQ